MIVHGQGAKASLSPPTVFVNRKPGAGFDAVDAAGKTVSTPPDITCEPRKKETEVYDQ